MTLPRKKGERVQRSATEREKRGGKGEGEREKKGGVVGARWGEGGMEGGQKRGHHDPHQHSCSPPISCSPPKSVSLACRVPYLSLRRRRSTPTPSLLECRASRSVTWTGRDGRGCPSRFDAERTTRLDGTAGLSVACLCCRGARLCAIRRRGSRQVRLS